MAAGIVQLSEREQEILALLESGSPDQEIADALYLSLNTVKWYNQRIYAKLGVRSRTQAIAEAKRLGLLAVQPATPPTDLRTPAASGSRAQPRIHFVSSFDGTRIAYAIAGEGPPLVKAANYMSHVEHDWRSPVWQHWMQELTREHTLISPDERGSGLSDWDVEDLSFEAWVRDLETVVETVGVSRFPLFAMSQAGAVAVAYAARHPDKVSRLILHGSYARGWLHRDLTPEQVEEEELMIRLMRIGWGRENRAFRQVFATQLFPDAPPQELRALEEQMRISVSPFNAARLEREMHRADIRHLAPLVRTPTLVTHSRHDEGVPFDEGRLLAALIPNAQFVALESRNHLLTPHEPAWPVFVDALRTFLAGDMPQG